MRIPRQLSNPQHQCGKGQIEQLKATESQSHEILSVQKTFFFFFNFTAKNKVFNLVSLK